MKKQRWLLNVFFVIIVQVSMAQTEVISFYDAGWYNETADSQPTQVNYYVGGVLGPDLHRNWFVFDLSGVNMTVGNATLRAYNRSKDKDGFLSDGYISPDEFETWSLFDVTTDLISLMNYTAGVPAYDDLGGGVFYGATNVSMADNGKFVEVTLNSDAITAINSGSGLFGIGGDITTMAPSYRQIIFASSHYNPYVELVLEEIPEPCTLSLLTLGTILAGRKRKNIRMSMRY